jgi:hypothetical protein
MRPRRTKRVSMMRYSLSWSWRRLRLASFAPSWSPLFHLKRQRPCSRGLPDRQPRDFDGDRSRLVLCQHLRPPRFGFAPSGVDVCERLPVGVVNPCQETAAMRNISEWMERDRSGRSKSGTPSRRRSRLRRPEGDPQPKIVVSLSLTALAVF